MAPTPTVTQTTASQPSSTSTSTSTSTPNSGKWNTPSIVGVSVFAFFILLFATTLTGFLIHRRRELKKLPPSHRPVSYHPFRTNSAKEGLLAQAEPTSDRDSKASMFSRDSRHSSVNLYVDETQAMDGRRKSVERQSLIPLHVSPIEDVRGEDPMDRAAASNGSGVSGSSRNSSRFSTASSGGSLGLSAIPVPGQELNLERPKGARRMSSARYYDAVADVVPPVPTIPKNVHSMSP